MRSALRRNVQAAAARLRGGRTRSGRRTCVAACAELLQILLQRRERRLRARKVPRLQRRRKRIQRLRDLARLLPAATAAVMVVMMHLPGPLLLLLLKILLDRRVILLRAGNIPVLQILR